MPKLNGIHIFLRLAERLAQLEAGEEIAAKEIRSLLTTEQQQELEDAWKEQQELRKGKRARTAEEEKALGWKTKREVAFPQFSRQILLSKSELEKCKCKEPNTHLSSKKRPYGTYLSGLTCLN